MIEPHQLKNFYRLHKAGTLAFLIFLTIVLISLGGMLYNSQHPSTFPDSSIPEYELEDPDYMPDRPWWP